MANNHKIFKQTMESMNIMVNSLDGQDKVLISVDEDKDNKQANFGPYKRTRGNLKKKHIAQTLDYK